jgi:hypothetical protein
MATQSCSHGRLAPREVLENLHDSQSKSGRHKCTTCAYQEGYQWGREHSTLPGGNEECRETHRRAPQDVIEALPESQAGPGRHKCCVCAYHEGFNVARASAIGGG